MGLVIPRSVRSSAEKVIRSFSRSPVLSIGERQVSFPAARTQKSKKLSQSEVESQIIPAQSRC